ncbi:hypothetical protein OEZ86_005041 [Tetradesmus obliquus]|nr:hypothetical protein OEZ86_005041 [Tetradesmus obliquus]
MGVRSYASTAAVPSRAARPSEPMTQLEDAKPALKPFAEREAPGPSNWLAVLEGCGIVKPGEQLTVASNFLQVVAGGVLAQKAAALKKLLLHLAPYNGVYMVFVRPPGARPHEWTPVYHGQATDQTVGERCASYLGGGVFCCDTTTDKCKMCKDFADRGFDVAVMFVPTIESMPKIAEAFMLGGWDFAANMTLNGNKVRPDMEVWFQGKLVRASSFLKLTALPDHEADMVRKAAAASYRQQQLAQAEMEDSRSALHSSNAEAASTPGSGSPRVAALSVAVTAAQLAPHTLDIMHGISAAIRPITRLALMAQDTGPAAAAARALDTWLHATGCDGPRQLLKEWGLKVPSKTPMHNVKVSEA